MTTKQLQASLRLWERREAAAHRNHIRAEQMVEHEPDREAYWLGRRRLWVDRERKAEQMIARRREQLEDRRKPWKPPMVTAAQLGLRFQYLWGEKGTVYRGAWHYTAGPRAAGAARLIELVRQYHAMHPGGLAYEAVVADDGTVALIGPMDRKGAAVALNNTGMVNICAPGTTGDRLTGAQERSIRWLRDNWHTTAVPKPHRLPKPAKGLDWRGHREHPNQSTACPGSMLEDYKECWK